MREFSSFGALATHLITRRIAVVAELEHGLDRALVRVEKTAHDEIGYYQSAIGPFPAWEQLADSTEERKAQAGYPPNAPLYATGDMQESLGHERHGLEGAVGATDPTMVFHEFGTSKMPPRPVLGPAGLRNIELIKKLVGAAALAGLVGGDQIHSALGYDVETKA
jgi:hypothetical protein